MNPPSRPSLQPSPPTTDILRLITCGNVDDGKSTLLGRLLHDTNSILDDQWEAVRQASVRRGDAYVDLALLADGLRAEREQGITIDVAYRYFATDRRKFIVADCPGHFQYTRNMVTGASSAHLALLLVDVRRGLTEQTCRHAFIASLFRIRHLMVCINKMDLVQFQQAPFEQVRDQFMEFAERLDLADIQFIPISAVHGDNVVEKSGRMPWFGGPPLLYALEHIYVRNDPNHVDARFAIQTAIRPQNPKCPDFRGVAGQVSSGVFRRHDEVLHLPSGFVTRIRSIRGPSGMVDMAFHPMSVVFELEDSLDAGRGDMLCRPNNAPRSEQHFDVLMFCLTSRTIPTSGRYLLRHTTRQTRCLVESIRYKINVQTLQRIQSTTPLEMNELARVSIRTASPVFCDAYNKNRQTGCMILIDESSKDTVAAALVL